MADNLDKAISEVISAMNQKMGLHVLLQVPTINDIHGLFGGADFYRAAIVVLKGLIEVAEARGLVPIVQDHTARLAFAQSMLGRELQRIPIPTTALDAEPEMRHYPDGTAYIVTGGGPQNGGYSIELRGDGENRFITR